MTRYNDPAETIRNNYRRQGADAERKLIMSFLRELELMADDEADVELLHKIQEQIHLGTHYIGGIGVRLA